jgi:nucleotide-binding universal stress UspA family protein
MALRSIDTPAHAIVDYARDEKIDLIIVGTHGRKGLSHELGRGMKTGRVSP